MNFGMEENMFKYALFDLDGTLTDPKIGITSGVQYALKKFGIDEPDLDKLEPFIGPPLKETFMEKYSLTEEQALQAVDYYREYFEPKGIFQNKVYPGIPEMLKHLQKAGIHLAVASSKPEVFVIRILEHFDIFQYFEVAAGSILDGTRTKKEEVVEETLLRLSDHHNGEAINKENCVMIGDRKFDVEGARAFDLYSIGVAFGYADEGELEKAAPDYIAQTVEELERYLLEE